MVGSHESPVARSIWGVVYGVLIALSLVAARPARAPAAEAQRWCHCSGTECEPWVYQKWCCVGERCGCSFFTTC